MRFFYLSYFLYDEGRCVCPLSAKRINIVINSKGSFSHLFGNTEEQCRVDINLGCKPRGRKSDGPFRHDTGAGWAKGKKGAYNDAIYKKNNAVEVLLHENLGGGF